LKEILHEDGGEKNCGKENVCGGSARDKGKGLRAATDGDLSISGLARAAFYFQVILPMHVLRTDPALSLRIPRAIIQQKRIKDIQRLPRAKDVRCQLQDKGTR